MLIFIFYHTSTDHTRSDSDVEYLRGNRAAWGFFCAPLHSDHCTAICLTHGLTLQRIILLWIINTQILGCLCIASPDEQYFYAIFKSERCSLEYLCFGEEALQSTVYLHSPGKYLGTQGMCLGLLDTFSVDLRLHIHTSFHFFMHIHILKPVSDQHCSVHHDTLTSSAGSLPEGEAVMRNYWYKMVREFQNTHTRKRPLKNTPAPPTSALCLYELCGG